MRYRLYKIRRFQCDGCGEYVGDLEGWDAFKGSPLMGKPYVADGNDRYCPNCALRRGLITAEEWLDMVEIEPSGTIERALYKDGTVAWVERVGKRYHVHEVVLLDEYGNPVMEELET